VSDGKASAAATRGRAADWIMLALVVGGVAAFVLWALGGADRQLRRSPIGFDGLVAWLRDGGLEARGFQGGALLERERVGLRILPLYDGNIDHWRTQPEDQDALIREADQVDIRRAVVLAKIRLLPTLVVLPKWRTGVALTGVAHPVLLRDAGDDPLSRGQLPGIGGRLERPAGAFRDFGVEGSPRQARLYLPQVLRGADCVPLVGDRQAMLLGRCGGGNESFWVLSDPDLLNSHGLRLGDNAAIARELLGRLAAGRPVVVDYSTLPWSIEDRPAGPVRDERRWSDLARFVEPPFAWLWAGFAALAALLLWRAALRFGPPLRPYDDGPRAAREVGIAAKARLLRLTGRDDALLRAHVAGRLQALAAELLGPHRPDIGSPLEQVGRAVGRRDPSLDRRLREAVAEAEGLPTGAPTSEAVRRLDRFETIIEQVLHGFGRASRGR